MSKFGLIDKIVPEKDRQYINDNSFKTRCPAHEDNNPSLSVTRENDKILLKCFGGCSTEKVLDKWKLTFSDLFIDDNTPAPITIKPPFKPPSDNYKKYNYYNENNELVFWKVRYYSQSDGGKNFYCEHKDGDRTIKGKPKNIDVLYNLPNLINAIKEDKTVFFCEGEKDVDTLEKYGLIGSCNYDGGGNRIKDKIKTRFIEYSKHFKDSNLIILMDNDEPGINFGTDVYNQFKGVCKSIKLINFSLLTDENYPMNKGYDFTDFITYLKQFKEYSKDKIIDELNQIFANTDHYDNFKEFINGDIQTSEVTDNSEVTESNKSIKADNSIEKAQAIYETIRMLIKEKQVRYNVIKSKYYIFDNDCFIEMPTTFENDILEELLFKYNIKTNKDYVRSVFETKSNSKQLDEIKDYFESIKDVENYDSEIDYVRQLFEDIHIIPKHFELFKNEDVKNYILNNPNSSAGEMLYALENELSNSLKKLYPLSYNDKIKKDNIEDLIEFGRKYSMRFKLFKKWLVGIIAQYYYDDVINRIVLVLKGEQGTYKSSFFDNLLPKALLPYYCTNFTVKSSGNENDENIKTIENILCVLDELDHANKSDSGHLKSIVTAHKFDIRRPYDRRAMSLKKISSFSATVNTNDFLSDPTGSTRFLVFDNGYNHINYGRLKDENFKNCLFKQCYDIAINEKNYIQLSSEEMNFNTENNRNYNLKSIEKDILEELEIYPIDKEHNIIDVNDRNIEDLIEKNKITVAAPLQIFNVCSNIAGFTKLNKRQLEKELSALGIESKRLRYPKKSDSSAKQRTLYIFNYSEVFEKRLKNLNGNDYSNDNNDHNKNGFY